MPDLETNPPPFPRRVINALLDLLFPRHCLVNGTFPGNSPYRFLSREGRASLRFIEDECCPTCGAPRPSLLGELGQCSFCRDRKFFFARSRSLVVYDDAARKIVHAVKYASTHAALGDLAMLSAEEEIFRRHLENSTLVPVPLSRQGLARRGYNQSEIFARELAKRIAGTRVEKLLVRTRDTGTQTKLSAISRRLNVRGAFAVPAKFAEKIDAGTRYVLIDDVFTTGSTLSECARALKKSGAKNVFAATFAHG